MLGFFSSNNFKKDILLLGSEVTIYLYSDFISIRPNNNDGEDTVFLDMLI